MKKIFAFIALTIILSSCKKSDERNVLSDPSQAADNVLTFTNLNIIGNNLPVKPKGTYNLLGYGYDVTGEFGNSSAAKNKIIDIDKLGLEHTDYLQLDRSTSGYARVMSARNCGELSKMLSHRLNNTDGMQQFKGSITSFFPEQYSLTKEYIYGRFSQELVFRRVYVINDPDFLQSYLLPVFELDVLNSSPKELIEKYGTHVLTNIELGAKLETIYQAKTRNLDREKSAEKGLTVSIRKIFGLNTGYMDYLDDTIAKGNYSQNIRFKTIGGDPNALTEIINPYTKTKVIEVGKWVATCTKENVDLINIEKNGVIPLYAFIKNGQKKEAVKNFIITYLIENEVRITN